MLKIEHLISCSSLKSTQDFALSLHEHRLFSDNSFAVRSDFQSHGRGQQRNTWESEEKQGLSFSLSLKELTISSKNVFIIHQLTTLAIIEALQEITQSEGFRVKWPNDIYLNDFKLAGILVQNSLNSKLIHASLIGVGLNISQARFSGLPNATSLKMEGLFTPSPDELMTAIIAKIEKYFNASETSHRTFFNRYQELLWKRNQKISLIKEDTIEEVILKAVSPEGKLCVLSHGKFEEYSYEEVKWLVD